MVGYLAKYCEEIQISTDKAQVKYTSKQQGRVILDQKGSLHRDGRSSTCKLVHCMSLQIHVCIQFQEMHRLNRWEFLRLLKNQVGFNRIINNIKHHILSFNLFLCSPFHWEVKVSKCGRRVFTGQRVFSHSKRVKNLFFNFLVNSWFLPVGFSEWGCSGFWLLFLSSISPLLCLSDQMYNFCHLLMAFFQWKITTETK